MGLARSEQSANPRKLLAGKHVHDAGAPNAGLHQDIARMIGGDFADNGGLLAKRVRTHRSKNATRVGSRKNREEFTFIGDIKRIETENLACSLDFFADRNFGFIEQHPHPRRLCNFAQRAGDASAGGIPQDVNIFTFIQDRLDETIERCGIAGNFRLEFQPFAHRHDGDAMHGDGSIDDDLVTRLRTRWLDVDARAHNTNTSGVDEKFIRFPAIDNFRVPGDEEDARFFGGVMHTTERCDENRPSASPSSRMKATERYWGRAPHIARSLTVPWTANVPMSPPGKKIGLTTYESVLKAIREPSSSKMAPSCKGASSSF